MDESLGLELAILYEEYSRPSPPQQVQASYTPPQKKSIKPLYVVLGGGAVVLAAGLAGIIAFGAWVVSEVDGKKSVSPSSGGSDSSFSGGSGSSNIYSGGSSGGGESGGVRYTEADRIRDAENLSQWYERERDFEKAAEFTHDPHRKEYLLQNAKELRAKSDAPTKTNSIPDSERDSQDYERNRDFEKAAELTQIKSRKIYLLQNAYEKYQKEGKHEDAARMKKQLDRLE